MGNRLLHALLGLPRPQPKPCILRLLLNDVNIDAAMCAGSAPGLDALDAGLCSIEQNTEKLQLTMSRPSRRPAAVETSTLWPPGSPQRFRVSACEAYSS